MSCDEHGCGSGQIPQQHGSVAGFVIANFKESRANIIVLNCVATSVAAIIAVTRGIG